MNIAGTQKLFPDCKKEIISLCKSLHMQNMEAWKTSLHSIEVKRKTSSIDSLLILKSLLPSVVSTQALSNLLQLFLRKITVLMEELNILNNEEVAKQTLSIVKDFWSLFSNHHVVLTQKAFGRYIPLLYEVLPSLASVYVDLFIAVHSSKNILDRASKRLYSWLMFELNERCMKTALLEVCQCTKAGANLLLPLLRKLLSKPPDSSSNLDYLLHFILLKRWAFVCEELHDLLQTHLAVKAPKNFTDWLTKCWPNAGEHLTSDKSLKGRRVSELLLQLDQKAVEELIDVFSHCLWSVEQISENTCKQAGGLTESAEQRMTGELFVIDKKGNEREEMILAEDIQPSKKKMKLWHDEKDQQNSSTLSNDIIDEEQKGDESDIFMLSGLMDDRTFHENSDSKNKDSSFIICQNEVITANASETDVDMSEEIEFQDRVQNLTHQDIPNEFGFVKFSEPVVSVVDLSNQEYVISSSEEDNVIIYSDLSSPTHSSSAKNFSQSKRKNKDIIVLSDSDTGSTAHNSSTSESKDIFRRKNHSKIVKSTESVEAVSDEDGAADRSLEKKTRAQVGLILSEIRKSMSNERKRVANDPNSFHIKTRLRNKPESTIPSGTSDLNKTRQGKTTPTKTTCDLTAWQRESPSRLLRKQKSPQTVMIKDEEINTHPTQSLMQDVKAVGAVTSKSTKEFTPADVFGKPLRTYSRRDQINSPIFNTTNTNKDDEPHQSRYFLRTNCSHRLHNNETACPTCSPKKMTPTPEKKN